MRAMTPANVQKTAAVYVQSQQWTLLEILQTGWIERQDDKLTILQETWGKKKESHERLTSSQGSHLLPKADTALQNNVRAKKMRKTCHVSPAKIPTPGSFSNTLMHETKNSVVPKLTARVIVMLPTTKSQPVIQLAMRLHLGEASIKA
jgi:hypothetical protein